MRNGRAWPCRPRGQHCNRKGVLVSTEDIQNFYKVDERIITGGQPTEGQIRSVAEDGYQVVVNLATIDPRYSLDDEGGLAQSVGMDYHHIPVEWGAPTAADFDAFVVVILHNQ